MWSSHPTPGHTFRENITWKYTCTSMFIDAVFTITKMQKQPKCPLTDECIKKMRTNIDIENKLVVIK